MSDILNCGAAKQQGKLVRFTYQCPKQWRNLQQTENNGYRFCDVCQENVFYCTDKKEAEEHARQRHCIAISGELTDAVDRQYDGTDFMFMGRMPEKLRPENSEAWGKDIFSQARSRNREVEK